MNLSRQSGVALVQVLLISALLLLLVVQLSLTAKKSVNLAIRLKTKSQASLQALNQFANAQYFLLTQQQGYSLSWSNGESVDFSGSVLRVKPRVNVRLQDMSGLLSTSFFGQEWNNYVGGDNQKLDTLKRWQGLSETTRNVTGERNARLPYAEEIRLLSGWNNEETEYITRLPTGFFNTATAPVALLREIYPDDTVSQILELRSSQDFVKEDFNVISGLGDSTAFPRSNFIKVNVDVETDSDGNIQYSRNRIYDVQTGKIVPILEIGIATP